MLLIHALDLFRILIEGLNVLPMYVQPSPSLNFVCPPFRETLSNLGVECVKSLLPLYKLAQISWNVHNISNGLTNAILEVSVTHRGASR
jgi:hypothetical protein